jgi:hypothetical protein
MKNSKKLEKEGLDIINDIQNKIEKNNIDKSIKDKKILYLKKSDFIFISFF